MSGTGKSHFSEAPEPTQEETDRFESVLEAYYADQAITWYPRNGAFAIYFDGEENVVALGEAITDESGQLKAQTILNGGNPPIIVPTDEFPYEGIESVEWIILPEN